MVTTGKVHDVPVAKALKVQPGTIILDGRGYNDYELFGRWTDEGGAFHHAPEGQRSVPSREESAGSARAHY